MIKLTITQIGTPKEIQTSKGPAQKNYIKAQECGNEYLNYFVNKTSQNWKIGDVVEVESVEKRDYTAKDGTLKTSHDIKFPRYGGNNAELLKRLEIAENQITKLGLAVANLESKVFPDSYPTPESEGLDPNNMANFDDAELKSLDKVANNIPF